MFACKDLRPLVDVRTSAYVKQAGYPTFSMLHLRGNLARNMLIRTSPPCLSWPDVDENIQKIGNLHIIIHDKLRQKTYR